MGNTGKRCTIAALRQVHAEPGMDPRKGKYTGQAVHPWASEAAAAAEARDVKVLFLVVYLAGIAFTLEQRLQRRQEHR